MDSACYWTNRWHWVCILYREVSKPIFSSLLPHFVFPALWSDFMQAACSSKQFWPVFIFIMFPVWLKFLLHSWQMCLQSFIAPNCLQRHGLRCIAAEEDIIRLILTIYVRHLNALYCYFCIGTPTFLGVYFRILHYSAAQFYALTLQSIYRTIPQTRFQNGRQKSRDQSQYLHS